MIMDQVRPFYYRHCLDYIQKLYLMGERDQKGSFIVDDRSVLTTAAARVKRLNSARDLFEAFVNKKRPKCNEKEAESWESRKQGIKEKHDRELAALKAVTLADVKVRGKPRYQGDTELTEELQREIEDAYSTRASAEEGGARVFITPIEMEFHDPASGTSIIRGDVGGAARNKEEGKVMELMERKRQEDRRGGSESRIGESGEESMIDVAIERVEVKQRILSGMSEAVRDCFLKPAVLVSQGPRRGKATIKELRSAVGSAREVMPYVPMTMRQYYVLRRAYIGDYWTTASWRTSLSAQEIEGGLMECESELVVVPKGAKRVGGLEGVSPSTVRRVVERVECKGMSDTEEFLLIEAMSSLNCSL